MGDRLEELEAEVASLSEEVKFLRREVGLLRRELSGRRGSESSVGGSADRSPGSPSRSTTSYSLVGTSAAAVAAGQSGYQAPVRAENPPTVLTWAQRDLIAQEVGRFLVRALAGLPRGPSGRDQVPLASRIWIVARTFTGERLNPVRVCRTFTECKGLTKRGSDCGDSVFVGFASEREARLAVQTAELAWPSA